MCDKDKVSSLVVPSGSTERTARISSRDGSAPSSRTTSPADGTRSTSSCLSMELTLKATAQFDRLTLLLEMTDSVGEANSLEELLDLKSQGEELFKAFTKEHAYFEAVWPAAHKEHSYFTTQAFLNMQRTYSSLKRGIAKRRGLFMPNTASSSASSDTGPHTKLPDISLPEFHGDYAEWPTFSDLFKSLILENSRLSDEERLHYLRGCLKGESAQLISNLPLTGSSLTQAWEVLNSRYQNRRLIIQAHLDKLFSITTAQKNSSSLNKLISTVSEVQKALSTLGVESSLGDHMPVYHVTKHLDAHTREAWELSLGMQHEYPSYQKMHAFLTARVRAHERIEAAKQPASASTPKRTALQATQESASTL